MANIIPVDVRKTPSLSAANEPWQSMRGEMDRLFDRFGFGTPSLRRMFDLAPSFESTVRFDVPAVDITEDEKAYKIGAELPGLDEKDVEVSVTGDVLTVKGEKQQEKEEKNKNWYLSERTYGSFQRAFRLPDEVDRDKIGATCSNGVLTVTLPKRAEAQKQQKKIEVKAA